ncbi:hypothetical protein M902_1149 [Bacteriovorax sp. BAL6_X]|uniref:hypothetical protein n=1 Tax=Bacteriovorax sp. BAL6_X TaxID=1201290 RepID=UPI0003869ED3|nr:hypothetical protein [Bacteriovorax sp. BAL6_X]EPZ49620.1 hypothetical protein M902_1149 [Bacteriovorax sp. BAL6_X]
MKVLLILALSFLTLSTHAGERPLLREGGSGVGNGGDTVRLRFISTGNGILEYYKEGFKSISNVLISPLFLKPHLNIKTISTSKEILIDNLGNPVSAIGEPGKIILYVGEDIPELHWNNIFKNSRLANIMVLHELLRAQGINDDNYVYSTKVLVKQDILSFGDFKMKWAKQSFDIVENTQLRSFNSRSIKEELSYFIRANTALDSYNTIDLAPLITLNLKLSKELYAKSNDLNRLKNLRADYKLLREIIPMVDQLSFAQIKNNPNYALLNRLTLILLRDFFFKIRMTNFKLTKENSYIISNYTNDLLSAISFASEDWMICTGIEQSLSALSNSSLVFDSSDLKMMTSATITLLNDSKCY